MNSTYWSLDDLDYENTMTQIACLSTANSNELTVST